MCASEVFSTSDNLQVLWIDAQPVVTQVIHLHRPKSREVAASPGCFLDVAVGAQVVVDGGRKDPA